ncbi:uncharacterized protein EDB93DRAFT_1095584 [Suillus bovinus]|uniref:uncharacterized protein n=1 Tax=Suillus bovinus TaxID=48563 RepID=UPI001B860AAB|nr:uncharacterized protein EDB93DRAFT_1095584 [Suillus bovinus]KAG2129170.1 hypothetical protein EDB93DRAFT_1095584 [Suillus bovinus]
MDGSEIGLFGTLRLMKRSTDEQVAAFPIDEETVTFGRDPTCSVRLYYPEISALHAKIVFQERKAFLVVLGDAGLTIDGCPVIPSTNASLPTTIPVSNNCEIEIHKKRFIFSYPPKQLRSPLYNIDSPVKTENGSGGRRKLRMSMIHSAQVFTPRGKPSSDPLANLRILQSPLKQLVPSPRKPSALKNSHVPEADEIEEEIVLVESNTPHVVQEDKDLVILERVDIQALPPPTPPVQRPRPSMNIYKTPNKRTRPSLHRAVLIRSVHRAVMAREEEEEEKEVEEVIVGETVVEEGENHQDSDSEEFDDKREGGAGIEHEESDEDGSGADSDTAEEPTPQPSTWRKSLNAVRAHVVWPFRSSSTVPEESDNDDPQDEDEDEEAEDAQPPPPSSSPPPIHITPQAQSHLTPARAPRPLGSFMTPQVPHVQSGIGAGIVRGAGRNSFGGALRRVRVEPKWRIGDIEVRGIEEVKEEEKTGTGFGRTRVSEEERKVSTCVFFCFLELGKWYGECSLVFIQNGFSMSPGCCDTGSIYTYLLACPSSLWTLFSLCHFSPP